MVLPAADNGAMRPRLLIVAMLVLLSLSPRDLVGEARGTHSAQGATTTRPTQPLDINHATVEQLLTVPGMTRTWALRIVRFRPYRTKQDLQDEGVLPGDVYTRVKDYLIAHREKK